ncbi:hypothetical protein ISS07_01560 [Candidatus Woesearchaeota archaeon]|nr:hypothetical protein [Candidatus Woesearchaeota archaeon]
MGEVDYSKQAHWNKASDKSRVNRLYETESDTRDDPSINVTKLLFTARYSANKGDYKSMESDLENLKDNSNLSFMNSIANKVKEIKKVGYRTASKSLVSRIKKELRSQNISNADSMLEELKLCCEALKEQKYDTEACYLEVEIDTSREYLAGWNSLSNG